MTFDLEQRIATIGQILSSHQHDGISTDKLRSLDMQLIGRVALGSAATSLSVGFPVKKYLRIIALWGAKSGTSDDLFRFNGDSGNNYTTTTGQSQAQCDLRNGANSALGGFSIIEVANNLSTLVKPVFIHTVNRITSAATAISSYELFASWVNTTAFINAVSLTSSGAATYPSGSELLVFSAN